MGWGRDAYLEILKGWWHLGLRLWRNLWHVVISLHDIVIVVVDLAIIHDVACVLIERAVDTAVSALILLLAVVGRWVRCAGFIIAREAVVMACGLNEAGLHVHG